MKIINKLFFYMAILFACSTCIAAAAKPTNADKSKPNIVLVVADDMSWADVGCYGNKDVKTPTLDALAQEGMRFTHCFTATAMCAPTRQQLYTGLFPKRNGAVANPTKVRPGTLRRRCCLPSIKILTNRTTWQIIRNTKKY